MAKRSQEYHNYISSTQWREFRLDYFRNYDKECWVCKSKGDIHLHHRTYENFKFETFNDVVPLCKHCHEKLHELISFSTSEYREKILIKFKNEYEEKYKSEINKKKKEKHKRKIAKIQNKENILVFSLEEEISKIGLNFIKLTDGNLLISIEKIFILSCEISENKKLLKVKTKDINDKGKIRVYDITCHNCETLIDIIKRVRHSIAESDVGKVFKEFSIAEMKIKPQKKKKKKKFPKCVILRG